MNEGIGGPGVGPIDLALALNRAVLGLIICFLFIPRYLETGRFLLFVAATVGAIVLFGVLHIYAVGPSLHAMGVKRASHICYDCYLTQTLPAVATMAVVTLSLSFVEQQKQAAVTSREHSDAELRFLRAQMNPHLLFNSLNNVYSYALEKSNRAPEMILKLSGVLRYMLYEAGDGLVPLRRELDYIRDYFELQQLSTEGRGDVSLSISGDPGDLTVAPMILIVFIENCFKHAVETTDRLFVHVSIRIEGDTLLLEARNNLPAPEAALAVNRVGGIGLENVRRRLELLYPGRFSLQAQPLGSAYHARLQVALAAP